MSPTPAQLAILRSRFPGIGEPALIRNAATLLGARGGDLVVRSPFGPGTAPTIVAAQPAKKRLRQHEGDGMNKTERAFLGYLQNTYPGDTHHSQAISLRLANGANYRPDFISVRIVLPATAAERTVARVCAWETKGFKREASAVRIKVAASLYPWITFYLVTKRRAREGGGWAIEPVLP